MGCLAGRGLLWDACLRREERGGNCAYYGMFWGVPIMGCHRGSWNISVRQGLDGKGGELVMGCQTWQRLCDYYGMCQSVSE